MMSRAENNHDERNIMHVLNGLQLKDPSVSLFDVVETVEHHINQRFTELAIQHTSAYIADIVDNPTFRKQRYGKTTLYAAAEHNWKDERIVFKNQGSRKYDPFAFFMHFGKTAQGKVLALPYTPTDEYITPLQNTNLFTEYAYSSNVEKPSYLSDDEWQQRAKDWWSLTNNTLDFDHLLKWTLNTKKTFYYGLDRDKNFDINEHFTPTQRLTRILANAIHNAYDLAPYAEKRLDEFISNYLENTETLQLPPPIPSLRQKVGDLPDPFVLNQDLFQDIVNKFTEHVTGTPGKEE